MKIFTLLARTSVALCFPALLSNCAPNARTSPPEARNDASSASASAVQAPEIRIGNSLRFSDALAKTMVENPGLQSFSLEIRAREARRVQASLYPNPVLGAEVENFGGSGSFNGIDRAESTVKVGQKIPLGGDIQKREEVAKLRHSLAEWDFRSESLDVFADMTTTYVSALEAQEALRQQKELLDTSKELFDTVKTQFDAGQVAELQVVKARVALSNARISVESARSKVEGEFGALAAFWASASPRFKTIAGKLEPRDPIPAYQSVAARIGANPDLARWNDEIRERSAIVASEKAKGVPDITVSGGVKQFQGDDAASAIIGASIPLQFFDRNQGAIQAAQTQVERAQAGQREARAQIHQSLKRAYGKLQASSREVRQLDANVLPDARIAFEAARSGYKEGKFGYLEVLDAQRTLFAAELRHLRALGESNRAAARVERLTGTSLSEL